MRYIQVILPVRLGWEPFYSIDDDLKLSVGDRVRLSFAGRPYRAVVSAVDVPLDSSIKAAAVRKIHCPDDQSPSILPDEIAFWRKLAGYYMCTVGEVYKAAYPSLRKTAAAVKQKGEAVTAEPLPSPGSAVSLALENLRKALGAGKTVLWEVDPLAGGSSSRQPLNFVNEVFVRLCSETTRNVLWLVPEIRFSKAMEKRLSSALGDRLVLCNSALTPAGRSYVESRLRDGRPYVLLGTRFSLFLPHHDLGLVIVQQEQDSSYKQTSPAPRYNGRDAAAILASLHRAGVVLTSAEPSLESLANCLSGKYLRVGDGVTCNCPVEVIDMGAELRKNGVRGLISNRLIQLCGTYAVAVYKPRRAVFPKMEELTPQIDDVFGSRAFITDDLVEKPFPSGVEVLVIFGVDALLGRTDFRSDEKALQLIRQAERMCGDTLKLLVIQTREPSHSIFTSLIGDNADSLLGERRCFGYPPFTRLVDVIFSDPVQERATEKCSALRRRIEARRIGTLLPFVPGLHSSVTAGIRIAFAKDRTLADRKEALHALVEEFECSEKYFSHIAFDVDPQ